jgi:hypothetical protein
MVSGPIIFGPEARQHIVAGVHSRGSYSLRGSWEVKERERAGSHNPL